MMTQTKIQRDQESILTAVEREMKTLTGYAEGRSNDYDDVVGAAESIVHAITLLNPDDGRVISAQYTSLRQQCDERNMGVGKK